MACEAWQEKLDLYADGELDPKESATLSAHMRICAGCAANALERVQLKRSVALAGNRYQPSATLRAKIASKIAAKPQGQPNWWWRAIALPAVAVLLVAFAVSFYVQSERTRRERTYSELTDLHVALLASVTPFDVISTDRHTVKPWFQGKVPFTFNLPEAQGSQFTLLGGRVTYLEQEPGAHLVYQLRKHEISVFILQDRGATSGLTPGPAHALSFNMESWTQGGLRYFVVGDAEASDIEALSNLLRGAG